VSRTIGDISMKTSSLIISDPDMFATHLSDVDQFLILACDGVWDVVSNQQAIDCVKKSIQDPDAASKALAEEALKRGSTDNISVVVVFFQYRRLVSSSSSSSSSIATKHALEIESSSHS